MDERGEAEAVGRRHQVPQDSDGQGREQDLPREHPHQPGDKLVPR